MELRRPQVNRQRQTELEWQQGLQRCAFTPRRPCAEINASLTPMTLCHRLARSRWQMKS